MKSWSGILEVRLDAKAETEEEARKIMLGQITAESIIVWENYIKDDCNQT